MRVRLVIFMLIAAALMLTVALSATAAQRTVLVEGFTQWNCGPCAQWNPQERAIVEPMTRDTVLNIKYHGWWPGADNDAFHLWNVAENTARINFYSCNWEPWVMCDGTIDIRNVDAATLRNGIRTRYALAAPCTIQLVAVPSGPRAIHVTGTITATDSAVNGTNDKLFVALITDQKHYPSAPGSNGETFFPDAFRDMWPNTTGQTISLSLGDTYQIDATLNKDSLWSPDSLSVIAFIQNTSTHWMHQAGWTSIHNDYSMNESSQDPAQMIIEPSGGGVSYTLQLENVGRLNDTYTVSLSDIPAGWTQSISADGINPDPHSIDVPLNSGQTTNLYLGADPSGHAGSANLTVTATSQGADTVHTSVTFRLMAGLNVLLVDDDGGVTNFQNYYLNALQVTEPNRVVGWWDLHLDALDENMLPSIPLIIWETGSSTNGNTLSTTEQNLLTTYLNNGGKLFLTGQGIAWDIRSTSFMSDVLHSALIAPYSPGLSVTGVTGNPISGGLNYPIQGGDGANNQGRQDKIMPADQYASMLWGWYGVGADTSAAVQITTPVYQAVFMAFGFEAISTEAMRDTVMARIVDGLLGVNAASPSITLNPSEFALGQNYPNPFNPSTVIPYALPERANVSLRVFDLLGRQVAELATGVQEAGVHAVTWNAAAVSSGVYFYRLEANSGAREFRETRKLMLLK